MTRERDTDSVPESVHDAAADWLAKHERGMDSATKARFARWRDAGPAHRRAYEAIDASWRDGAELPGTATGRDRLLIRAPFHLRRSTHVAAAAASVVIVAGLGLTAIPHRWQPGSIVASAEAESFQTAIGEIKTVPLADGSRLTLDTNTRVEVGFSPRVRRVVLDRGRVRVAVAADPARPFVVQAAARQIKAHNAVFDVATSSSAARVTVVRGAVELHADASTGASSTPTALASGQQAAWGTPAMAAATALAHGDWASGMVALDATPLAEAVATINRYNRLQLRLDAPELARLPISGAFRARDPEGFARAVAALHRLRIVRRSSDLLVLTPRGGREDIPQK